MTGASGLNGRAGAVACALAALLDLGGCVVLGPGKIPVIEESPESRVVPLPAIVRLDNGLEVWHLESARVPVAEVAIVIRGGATLDPPGKAGLAALTLAMLDEGAGERSALELADEIDFLGASIEASADRDHSVVRLRSLVRNLDSALALLADVVLRPRFDSQEWERSKSLWLNDLVQRREEPTIVARVVGDRFFYGDGHAYGRPIDGFEADVRSLELADVKALYGRLLDPRRAIVLCVGAIARDDLAGLLEKHFGSWKTPRGEPLPIPEPAAIPHRSQRVVVVDKPDAPQTVIRVQLPAPSLFTAERAPLELANIVFGRSFTSRLSMNLREKNKFTYGAGSDMADRVAASCLVAQSSVYAQTTAPALREFCREFRRMGSDEGLSAYEDAKARSTYRIRLLETLETARGTLDVYLDAAAAAKPPITARQFFGRVVAQQSPGIVAACKEVFRWENALVVLVGDRELIESQLEELARAPGDCRLPAPRFADQDGNPLPAAREAPGD